MPKIKFKLDAASIEQAIKEIEKYKQRLSDRTELFRRRLAIELAARVRTGFNGDIYDDVLYEGMRVPDVQVEIKHTANKSSVIANGEEAVLPNLGQVFIITGQ